MSTIFTFKEMYLGGQFGFITTDKISDEDLANFQKYSNYVYCLNNVEGTIYTLRQCGGLNTSSGDIDASIVSHRLGIAIFNSYPNSPTIRLTDAEKTWLFSNESKNHIVSQDSLELGIQTLFNVDIATVQSQNLLAYTQDIIGRSYYIFDNRLQLHSFKCVDVKHERYSRTETKKPLINFVIGAKTNNNVCEKYKFFFTNASQYKIITVCVTFEGEVYIENGGLTDSMIFSTQNAAMFHLNEIKLRYVARLDICKQYIESGIISEPLEKILKLLNDVGTEKK